MDKILLVGKVNDFLRNLNDALSAEFQVQLSSPDTNMVLPIVDISRPDLIIISMLGGADITTSLFEKLSQDYMQIPVITIASKVEVMRLSAYFVSSQFENLIRPVDNETVIAAVKRRLQMAKGFSGGFGASPMASAGFDDSLLLEAQAAMQAAGIPGPGTSGKKLVMIVDDNAGTLRSLKSMMDTKYDVVVCTSGVKALTMIGKRHPDVILLDYEMPVCDGKQTLELIRADEDICNIPVIFLTGVDDRAHIEAVLALRPDGYILKPPVASKLFDTIEKVVNK